jgi:hypothetical protein
MRLSPLPKGPSPSTPLPRGCCRASLWVRCPGNGLFECLSLGGEASSGEWPGSSAFYSPRAAVAATFTGTFALTSIGRFAILSEEVTTHTSPGSFCGFEIRR